MRNPNFIPRHWLACLLTTLALAVLAEEKSPGKSPFREAVDDVQKAAHAHPDRSPAYFAELEAGFRRLQPRFPGEAEIYAELLFIADHTSGEGSKSLAQQILDWPAPEDLKDKTRGVLRKKAALGKEYELTLPPLGGSPIVLSKLRGKVVLLDFWATWCPPCREKLPELKSLYERLHPKGLEIIGLSFDDDLDVLKRFVAREQLGWAMVADGKGWNDSPRTREFGITSLPTMWLIDRRGRLRDVDARDDLAAKVQKLLDE